MSLALVASAAVAGLLSFFSPCILPLLPVYIGMLTTDATRGGGAAENGPAASSDAKTAGGGRLSFGRRCANTVAFVLGIMFVFVAMGAGAGAVGSLANNAYLTVACGLLVVVMGLLMAGVISVPALSGTRRFDVSRLHASGVAWAFVLGLAFSFGWTPCVGPIMGTILALCADAGSALAGAGLMLAYGLGLCVPFLVLTVGAGVLVSRIGAIRGVLPWIQRIGGALVVVMGLWMIFSQVHDLVTAASVPIDETDPVVAAAPASVSGTTAASQAGDTVSSATAASQASDAALAAAPATQSSGASHVSSAWKNVALKDLDGSTIRLSSLVGKPIYLEFWGSWCSSCVADLDLLKDLYAEHRETGDVQVVSIVTPGSFGEKDADDFVAWAGEQGVNFPCYMDLRASLVSYLGIVGFPSSVFIDSSGTVVEVHTGGLDHDDLEAKLSQLQ